MLMKGQKGVGRTRKQKLLARFPRVLRVSFHQYNLALQQPSSLYILNPPDGLFDRRARQTYIRPYVTWAGNPQSLVQSSIRMIPWCSLPAVPFCLKNIVNENVNIYKNDLTKFIMLLLPLISNHWLPYSSCIFVGNRNPIFWANQTKNTAATIPADKSLCCQSHAFHFLNIAQ